MAIGLAGVLITSMALGYVGADSSIPVVKLKVMTRNLYLGADLTPAYTSATLQEFIAAVTAIFAKVQASNFPERAGALADEIAATEPDLIGLQEASLWRSQTPSDLLPTPNAVVVEFDFLQLLLDALAARGLEYAPVAVVTNFDAEAPRFTPTGLQDIRLTDRDALLARSDLPPNQLTLSNIRSENFDTNLVLPTVVGPLQILRGWVSVDATLLGKTVRVVSTHLEPYGPLVNVIQGNELLSGPLATTMPVVLLGDLNSAADGSTTATYANLIAAGFADAWSVSEPSDPGLTCCQAEDLRNPTSILNSRIDFVLYEGAFAVGSVRLVGEDPDDRTPSGLWPSDHAGVWAKLTLP